MPIDEITSGGHMNEVSEYRQAVQVIKEAILRSQYDAARSVNEKQLKLYFGIGKYISANSRKGFWGVVDGQPIGADAFAEIDDSNLNLALASAKSSATCNLAIAIAKMKAPKMAPVGAKTNLQGHEQVVRGLCHS